MAEELIRRLSPEEAKKAPRDRIFKVPARIVRVNKTPAGQFGLQAKAASFSGAIWIRTWALYERMHQLRASRRFVWHWRLRLAAAGRAGFWMCRQPSSLARACPGTCMRHLRGVSPGELWLIIRSAYGLAEAPRLWQEKAREDLGKVGFKEVPFSPATFVYVRKLGKKDAVVAILCLHVDDGLLVADPTVLKEIRQKIEGHFNIKEWQQLGGKPSLYLGMKLSYVNGKFITDMKDYILEINFAKLEEVPCGRLLDAGLREFRRLVAQLRWLVHLVMPEFLFSVSAMAQRVGKATFGGPQDGQRSSRGHAGGGTSRSSSPYCARTFPMSCPGDFL